MKHFTLAALCAATLTVAACGGSSSGSIGSSDGDLPARYDGLEGFVAAAESDSLDEASGAMMSGSATMSGAIGIGDIGEEETLELLGDLSLTADFTGGTVTGTADNFALYDQDTQAVETAISGSLAIGGTIAGTSLTGEANGTLSDDEAHIVELDMAGTFYDYEGDLAVYGDVSGTIDGEAHDGGFAAVED